MHRVGRTGRAGRDGAGVTLVLPEEEADVSRVAARLGHEDRFAETGMCIAPPRLVYPAAGPGPARLVAPASGEAAYDRRSEPDAPHAPAKETACPQ